MMSIRSIFASLIVLFSCVSISTAQDTPARKPNVVLIVADDLGYADIGVQGIAKDVKTPNIDSIAANGVRFTNGYVSCPVCSPTRAGLLTGRYQQRFGFEWNPKGPPEERMFGLPLDQATLPGQMKKAGYATGMVGKWHLGHQAGMLPHERGFDEFFGFAGGAHRYFQTEQGPNAIQRNGTPVEKIGYLTDDFTREALAFIDKNKDKPFFLYLPYNAVHTPQAAPEKYTSRFADVTDEKRKLMLAMLAGMDDGVGQVLAKLREAMLEENTLVIFFSDNGGPTRANASLNTPFRGGKGETLEGGIRIPFMMQFKGRIPAGTVDERMVIQLDLVPTILTLAGAPLPTSLDGKDLLPFLTADNKETIHDTFYWRFGPRRAIRSGHWKLQWNGDETPHLYDMTKDPSESTDLAAANPKVVAQLMDDWKKWDAQLMPPRWPGRLEGGPARRGAAKAE
jgi:arylsulfatase A-like enzyme